MTKKKKMRISTTLKMILENKRKKRKMSKVKKEAKPILKQ